jgi:hypothetical protein
VNLCPDVSKDWPEVLTFAMPTGLPPADLPADFPVDFPVDVLMEVADADLAPEVAVDLVWDQRDEEKLWPDVSSLVV